jgi:hypothetical protein
VNRQQHRVTHGVNNKQVNNTVEKYIHKKRVYTLCAKGMRREANNYNLAD